MDMNKAFITGRICNDLELKQTTTGVPVTSFRVASERNFKNKDGERETDFLSIVAFKNTAEFITKYFNKGRKILICGRIQVRPYTDRDGNKRTATEIIADEACFADSNRQYGINGENPVSNNFQDIDDVSSSDLPF